jgi:hypothetical protein
VPDDQKSGRTPLLTAEIRKELIDRIKARDTLKSICADPRMPTRGTLRRLLSDKSDPELWAAANRAQKDRCYEWAEETLDIADRSGRDLAGAGIAVRRRDEVGRDRLRIKVRQWLLERLQPEPYRLSNRQHGSEPEEPPEVVIRDLSNLPDEEVIPKTDPSEKFRSRSRPPGQKTSRH